jgi:hypothetical protein
MEPGNNETKEARDENPELATTNREHAPDETNEKQVLTGPEQ